MKITQNRIQAIVKTAFMQDSAGVAKYICGSQQYIGCSDVMMIVKSILYFGYTRHLHIDF